MNFSNFAMFNFSKKKKSNKHKKSIEDIELNFITCKLGFRTKLCDFKKELNLQNIQNENCDIFLYFMLDNPKLCFKRFTESSNPNNTDSYNFNQRHFYIKFSYKLQSFKIDFEIKDIYMISKSKNLNQIIELSLNKDFKTFVNESECEVNSPFFDISENQILRYWIQQPVLRLEFQTIDYNINFNKNIFNEINSFLNLIRNYSYKNRNKNNNDPDIIYNNFYPKSKIRYNNVIFCDKLMYEINQPIIKSILQKYENEILFKMQFLTIDKRFAIFMILSSGVLKYPIDLDVYLLDLLAIPSSDKADNEIISSLNTILNKNKNNCFYPKFNNVLDDCFIQEFNCQINSENLITNGNEISKKDIQHFNVYKKSYDRITEFFKDFDLCRRSYKFKNNQDFFIYLYEKISNFECKVKSKRIKKLIITPNNLIFKYDSLNFTNRILDANRKHEENFLIVCLADRNLEKEFYSIPNKFLLVDFFKEILHKGIKLGLDIKFDFLCYSNSQLRSYSFWMINESNDFNLQTIFEKQGNFENIDNIASNASRRGLCLTSAKFFSKIPPENIIKIPDVEVIRDESKEYQAYKINKMNEGIIYSDNFYIEKEFSKRIYNFTDGIGQISISLAKKICKKLFKCDFATAFQIRIGGYKGVVAVHPELVGDKICLRPSMKKFESESTDLYVIRISHNSPGFLNRQIIYLLSELGVKNKIFEDMLEKDLKHLKNSLNSNFFINEGKDLNIPNNITNIIEILEKYEYKNKAKISHEIYNDFINQQKIVKQIILRDNPFFKGIYNSILINKLIFLKEKCKLYDENSGKFIGIIDELGLLKENECFIQVSKGDVYNLDQKNKGSIVSEVKLGAITITKNPCGYLEDVQVLFGVENEILEKIYFDVIVFPRTSQRPIQQLISGGDLDGDIYYVSWNSNLTPPHIIVENKKIDSLDFIEMNFKNDRIIQEENNLVKNFAFDKKENIFVKNKDIFQLNMESLFNEIEIRMEKLKNNNFRESLIDFFCLYLKNDNLGMICNSLMATSDLKGPKDQDTLILCIYQRKSVTFFKTGKTNLIKDFKKIDQYPDFMEKRSLKKRKKFYQSSKILGILYRKVKKIYEDEKLNLLKNDLATSIPKKYLKENLILFKGFEFFTKISWYFYEVYYNELNSFLYKHKLEREFEFITGIRSPIFDLYSIKQLENYDLKLDLARDSEKFMQKYKKEFLSKILKIMYFLLKDKYFRNHILYESYENLIKNIITYDSWNTFNNQFLKFNFESFENRFHNIIMSRSKTYINGDDNKIKIEEESNEEEIEINYFTISISQIEIIIEQNFFEILELDTKSIEYFSLENVKIIYKNFRKGLLTSIYYCSYFCFFKELLHVKQFVLNENLYNVSNKFLNERFEEIEFYEDTNINEDSPKNRNFFSMAWIIDTALLLEIKFA